MIVSLDPLSARLTYRFAQLEMTKYQLQASSKWGFDFIKESPITHANSQYRWEPAMLHDLPRFYHHIAQPTRLMQKPTNAVDVNDRAQLFSECENICPLSRSISAPTIILNANPQCAINKRKMVIASTSSSCNSHQRKITGELSLIVSLCRQSQVGLGSN